MSSYRSTMPKIVQISFIETLESPDMFMRPYQTVANDGDILNQLLETTRDGQDLSVNALVPVAGSILRPEGQVGSQNLVGIANGFDCRRWRVVLVLEVASSNMMSSYEVVTGYTDHLGITNNLGNEIFDGHMRLFFNHTVQYTNTFGGMNGNPMVTMNSATQLLTPLQGWDTNHDVPIINQGAQTMRPQDIFTRLSYGVGQREESLVPNHGGFAGGQGSRVLSDSRLSFGTRVKRNNRNNNHNADYLSRYFHEFENVMAGADLDMGHDAGSGINSMSEAAGKVADPLSAHDPFLNALSGTNFNHEWSITWSEMLGQDPTLEDRAMVVRLTAAQHSSQYMDTAGWNDVLHGPVAQMVINLIPGMMGRFALGMLHFRVTNQTMSGMPVVDITGMAGIADFIQVGHLQDRIKQELAGPIFAQISNSGRMVLDIDARISLSGMSTVQVGLNGGPLEPFTAPTYCDSLYAPVMANSVERLVGVANDLGLIGGRIVGHKPLVTPTINESILNNHQPVGFEQYEETRPMVGQGSPAPRRNW